MYRIVNYKNITDASIHLFRPVTVLIGSNGSGKSNTIEAIELLANLVHGRPIHDISDIGRGVGTFQIRGGLQSCAGPASSSFSLNFSFSDTQDNNKVFNYTVTINTAPITHIYNEELTYGGITYFSANSTNKSEIINVSYNDFSSGNKLYLSTGQKLNNLLYFNGICLCPKEDCAQDI